MPDLDYRKYMQEYSQRHKKAGEVSIWKDANAIAEDAALPVPERGEIGVAKEDKDYDCQSN